MNIVDDGNIQSSNVSAVNTESIAVGE